MAPLTIGTSGTHGTPLKGCVPDVPLFAPVLAGHAGQMSRLSRMSRSHVGASTTEGVHG
jgi:hypothetical protein